MENLNIVLPPKSAIKPVSSQEFQEMLNLWFEEKGVLKELRLQLRFKLVNLLKDTIIGKDTCKGEIHGTSLFNQAVNLIVAEYLIHSKCYYSLSVFNLEASFTSMLPKHRASDVDVNERDLYNLHFDRQNLLHILELIGVTKNTVYCDKLLSMYFNSDKKKSILCCLINLICQFPNEKTEMYETNLFKNLQTVSKKDPCDEIRFLQKIEEFLTSINLSNEHVKNVSQSIMSFYRKKSEEEKKELLVLLNQQSVELVSKTNKIRELQKSKNILQRNLLKTNKYYKKTKAHLVNLKCEENLSKENFAQQNPNIDYSNIKGVDLTEHNFKPTVSVLKQEKAICQIPHCSDSCTENIRLIESLSSENDILRKENKKQKESLKKLFLIYKDVLGKFNSCQNKLNFLNSKMSNKGLNEELLNNFLCGDNFNIKAPVQQNTDDSDVSSTSLTEEILHDARIKLQKLEDETKEIEDKFKHIHFM